jgi:hypothetical protein
MWFLDLGTDTNGHGGKRNCAQLFHPRIGDRGGTTGDDTMTPYDINILVSRMTAEGKSQTEIKDTVARLRGQMAPKSEEAPPPPDDEPPRAA